MRSGRVVRKRLVWRRALSRVRPSTQRRKTTVHAKDRPRCHKHKRREHPVRHKEDERIRGVDAQRGKGGNAGGFHGTQAPGDHRKQGEDEGCKGDGDDHDR